MFDRGARPPLRRVAAVTGALTATFVVLTLGSSVANADTASPSPTAGSSPSQSASPIPSPTPIAGITAQPSAALADGQYVRITLQNLIPTEAVFFRQCIANPVNLANDCTPYLPKYTRADANGGGSTFIPVHAFKTNPLLNLAGTAKIECDDKHDCIILGVTNHGHTYNALIKFAPSPTECPAQPATAPLGSGSAAASRAMYRWAGAICLPPLSLPVGYLTHNDHDAFRDFFNGIVNGGSDFGVTGLRPPPPTSPSPSPSPNQTYKLAPLTISATVLGYLAYDSRGTQITNLTLSPDIIAGLFMGQIANFSATPAITALNPGINFPPRTRVIARGEYNSGTYMFTSWLSTVARGVWQPPPSPAPDIFPSTGIYTVLGETGVGQNVVTPSDGFSTDQIYIGLMDSSTAQFYGLPMVRIAMPDGSVIAPTGDSVLEGVADSKAGADGMLVPQWPFTSDPDAYPLPMVTYMIAPTNNIDPAKGLVLANFLRYAVQDGQLLLKGVDGYTHLPAGLVQESLAIADSIPAPAAAPTDTSSSSTVPPDLSNLPPLPDQSTSAPGTTGSPATGGSTSGSLPTTVIAALTANQGPELVAAARAGPRSMPGQYALPFLVGLMLVVIASGLGLRLWARRLARLGA